MNAIKNSEKNEIRYKDIIDYISDEFSNFPEQTPFFITQADFTENFCERNTELNKYLKSIPKNFIESNENLNHSEYSSIEEMIKADAKKNVTFEQTNKLLQFIKSIVENFQLSSNIDEFYIYERECLKYLKNDINYYKIGQFVKQNPDFFASVITKNEDYDEIVKPSIIDKMKGITKPYKITKQRKVVSGYTLNVNYDYNQIAININSKYPNLKSFYCNIAFITQGKRIINLTL